MYINILRGRIVSPKIYYNYVPVQNSRAAPTFTVLSWLAGLQERVNRAREGTSASM